MKKRVIMVVAIVALVAILGIACVACNADSYVKKLDKAGFLAFSIDKEGLLEYGFTEEEVKELGIEWLVVGTKVELFNPKPDMVMVFKVKDASVIEDIKAEIDDMKYSKATGKLVVLATSQEALDAVK